MASVRKCSWRNSVPGILEETVAIYCFPATQMHFEMYESLKKVDDLSLKVIKNFSPTAASKLFDQEIREAVRASF